MTWLKSTASSWEYLLLVTSVRLKNFRNFSDKVVNFDPNINLILGDNGVGKTTVVEAIYFAVFLSSFRTKRMEELMKFGEKNASIELDFVRDDVPNALVVNFTRKEKKVFLNKKEIDKYQDLLSLLNVVVISPNNIDIINSSPSVRRRYLDQGISQIDVQYFNNLVAYKKLLKIKNKFLKSSKETGNFDRDYYEILTKKLNEYNKYIVDSRRAYLSGIEKHSKEIVKVISGAEEDISIIYKENKEAANRSQMQTERAYGVTMQGNHLDDYVIELNGLDVKSYGSQGQKRLSTIAYFLSQNSLVADANGDPALIVFDDVHLDLDETKQERLFEYLKDSNQIIYITTNSEKIKFLEKYKNLEILIEEE